VPPPGRQCAAVQAGEAAHDGKAQPGAASGGKVEAAFPGMGRPQRQLALGDARAGIFHCDEGHAPGAQPREQPHRAVVRCEFHRVGQEVEGDLAQRPLVAPQARRARHLGGQGHAGAGRQGPHHGDAVLRQGIEPYRRFHEGAVAALDAGEVEQVVGEGQQMLAGGVDVPRIAAIGLHPVGAQHLVRHHLGKAHHGVQRGAQLMAHLGQEP